MKTMWTVLVVGFLVAAASSAPAVDLTAVVVHPLSGALDIFQSLPAGCDDVNQSTPVTGGQIEITPAEGAPVLGGRRFVMTQTTVIFAPFNIHRDCLTQNVTRDYTALAVQAGGAIPFVATEGPPGVFTFSIPASEVILFEAATLNGAPETGYKVPKQPVTGTIDLNNGTVQMTVVAASKVHVDVLGDYDGTLTATISGHMGFPDADGDGVPDRTDNCKFVPNPDQAPVPTPTIQAPPAITLASCLDTQIGQATGADVCDHGAVAITDDAPGSFPVGTTVVTWSAEDGKARVATATQNVTVVDTTAPTFTFVPPDKTVADCGHVHLGHAVAVDDCGGTPFVKNDAPRYFGPGATTVTWKARDDAGNRATATQIITVHDVEPPVVSCFRERPHDHDHHGYGMASGHHDDHGDDDDGPFFEVSTRDNCTARMRFGGQNLRDGEIIKITPTHKPGVVFLGTEGHDHIKHFKAGPGDAVITSTDDSGNVATASCPLPRP